VNRPVAGGHPSPAVPPRRLSIHLLLIAVQICFASLAVMGKLALATLPANAIVLTRVTGGGIVFFLLARHRGELPVRLARGDLPLIVACGVLGVVVNQLFFVNGLALSTAVNASVLGCAIPVFTVGIAMASRREPFRPLRVLGIAVALAGTLVLVKVDRFSLSDAHAVGNLLLIINAFSYAAFLVLVRTLAGRIPPLALVTLVFAAAWPLVAPVGIPAWIHLVGRLTARDVALLAFIVAVPTVGAYALNQLALERADASLVAAYIYLQPLFAVAGAMLLLHERPGWRTLVAAALIGGGLWLSTLRTARRDKPRW
jgi:drug/metabolite transporter (DMT)-like permease